jgi:hypothetical protein
MILFDPTTCSYANWFIGEFSLFVLAQPVAAFLLSSIENAVGPWGFSLLWLLPLVALSSTLWFISPPTIPGDLHSIAYPLSILMDYMSFAVGASIALLSKSLVRRVPKLKAYPARSPCEMRPLVGAVGDVALMAMLAFGIFEGYRCRSYATWNATQATAHLCEDRKMSIDPMLTNLARQHYATWLIALYMLASISTLGAGVCSRVLRQPVCTTLGSLALEIFVLSEGWKTVFVQLGFGSKESFDDPYSPVLYLASLILLAHVVVHKVVQPLLTSDVCKCDAACFKAPNERTGETKEGAEGDTKGSV